MTGPFTSVNGFRVVSGELLIPLVGAWTADLRLATPDALTGPVVVAVGNLTLRGTVYRSSAYGGQTRCRLVGGAGGWRSVTPSQGYGDPNGVQVGTVLGDVASAASERMGPLPSGTVGTAYTRAESTASEVLWQLLAVGKIPAWRIDPDGVTQVTPWPSTLVGTPFTATDQRPDEGVVVVATEDYAAWLPGVTFTSPPLSGTLTSAGVHYVWTPDGQFRLEVLTGSADRVLGALEEVIARQVAPTRWLGRYAYTISNPSTTTIDATPVNPKLGLPELAHVPLVGSSVATYTPPDGGACRIMFVDGDPAQPECVWTAMAPTMAQILSGPNPIARLGDQVQCFLPPALPCVVVVGGVPSPGTLTVAAPISGVITQGSRVVSSA